MAPGRTHRAPKALLGYQHLVDVKTLLPGQRYRTDKDGTTSSVVNARQEEVSPDYEKKAKKRVAPAVGVRSKCISLCHKIPWLAAGQKDVP